MNNESLIITVFAQDRPGVLQQLSDVVLAHKGNWLESSLSQLRGQFAGIARVKISPDNKQALIDAFDALKQDDINVTIRSETERAASTEQYGDGIEILVEANDRPGIVEEIAAVLAKHKVNVVQMDTACESASMAGYQMFYANLTVELSAGYTVENLEMDLESVSDDLIVTLVTA